MKNKNILQYAQISRSEPKFMILDIEGQSCVICYIHCNLLVNTLSFPFPYKDMYLAQNYIRYCNNSHKFCQVQIIRYWICIIDLICYEYQYKKKPENHFDIFETAFENNY